MQNKTFFCYCFKFATEISLHVSKLQHHVIKTSSLHFARQISICYSSVSSDHCKNSRFTERVEEKNQKISSLKFFCVMKDECECFESDSGR